MTTRLFTEQINPNVFGGGAQSNVRTITGTATVTKDDVGKQILCQNTSDTLPVITIDETGMSVGDRLYFQGDHFTNMSRTMRLVSTNAYDIGSLSGRLITERNSMVLEFVGDRWRVLSNARPSTSSVITFFNNSMTQDEIQACITSMAGQYAYASTDYYFDAGTYTLSNTLYVFSHGRVRLYGDTTVSALSTTQNVILEGPSGLSVILLQACLDCRVQGFRLKLSPNGSGDAGVQANATSNVYSLYNYVYNTDTIQGAGFYSYFSGMYSLRNYVDNVYYGIRSYSSKVYSNNTVSTGTNCVYGLRAESGGTIGKGNTQPVGSSANEQIVSGGRIA